MANLIERVLGRITPEVVQKLAGRAGITPAEAERAISAIVPAQLDALASLGATPAGAARLMGLLKEHNGAGSFAPVLAAGDAQQRLEQTGITLQSAIYGDELDRRIGCVASTVGIPRGAAASLMSMIMPAAVGILGQEVRDGGFDSAGLVTLLRGQHEAIRQAMPAALSDCLERRPGVEAQRIVQDRSPVEEPPVPVPAAGPWQWLLPLLAVLALGAGLLWWLSQRNQVALAPAAASGATVIKLAGTAWRWERTQLSDGSEQRPGDPSVYTLDFRPDGNIAVKADCKGGETTYTADGAALAIGPLVTTLQMCPGESLADVFLQQVQNSGSFLVRDGRLIINLKADAGNMEFVPVQ